MKQLDLSQVLDLFVQGKPLVELRYKNQVIWSKASTLIVDTIYLNEANDTLGVLLKFDDTIIQTILTAFSEESSGTLSLIYPQDITIDVGDVRLKVETKNSLSLLFAVNCISKSIARMISESYSRGAKLVVHSLSTNEAIQLQSTTTTFAQLEPLKVDIADVVPMELYTKTISSAGLSKNRYITDKTAVCIDTIDLDSATLVACLDTIVQDVAATLKIDQSTRGALLFPNNIEAKEKLIIAEQLDTFSAILAPKDKTIIDDLSLLDITETKALPIRNNLIQFQQALSNMQIDEFIEVELYTTQLEWQYPEWVATSVLKIYQALNVEDLGNNTLKIT